MNYLYISIPVSLLLGIIILLLYLWAAKKGQFDDMEGPKYRMLDDGDEDMDFLTTDETEKGTSPPAQKEDAPDPK